jgi:Fur family transcriptional regulator, ferric uptake regulator
MYLLFFGRLRRSGDRLVFFFIDPAGCLQQQSRPTAGDGAARLAGLAASGQDFRVEDLWRDLQQYDPRLGRTTVFRAVEMLVNMGILNRIEFSDGSHTYRACGDSHHHHLTCKKCHRVVDVEVCIPEGQLAEIGLKNHFEIEGHSLVLFGICADCREEMS